MIHYELDLDYPPSNNTYWRHARGRHYISEKGISYRDKVKSYLVSKLLDVATTKRLSVVIKAHAPDKRKRDLDNLPKATLDALVYGGFMIDDSQIDDLRIIRAKPVKGGKLTILIKELE